MALMSHFIATPAPGKTPALPELEGLIVDLLHSGSVQLPSALFIGETRYEPRYTEEEDAEENAESIDEEIRAFHKIASQYIIPNAPEDMIHLVTQKRFSPEIFWAYEKDEKAFLEALHRVPFGQQNVCISFPFLAPPLQQCGWAGAVIYVLTRSAFIDFIHPTAYEPIRLIDREIACFFTLASFNGGSFSSSEAKKLLLPSLEKYFGDDVEMAETAHFPF